MLDFLGVLAAGTATLAMPCVLPLVPIYLAMLMGGSVEAARDPRSRWRLLTVTTAFALGFIAVFTVLGLGASSLGQLLSNHRGALTLAGALVIILLGFTFLDLLHVPGLNRDVRLSAPRKIQGVVGGFAFGVVFALGWTPCAGPVLATVLSYAAMSQDVARGAALLSVYGLGMALPLVLIAAFADRALPALRRMMRWMPVMQRVTGAGMILLGVSTGAAAVVELQGSESAAGAPIVGVNRAGETLAPLLGAPLARPRLVELVEEGCTVCQRMVTQVAELQRNCTSRMVDVEVVSLSDGRNAKLRTQVGVRAVPVILLVDDEGTVRERLVGERTLEQLRGLAAGLQATECAGVAPLDARALPQGKECPSGASTSPGTCG